MKKLNFKLFVLFTLLLTLPFTSCDNDGYDLGNFAVYLATVNTTDDSGTYYLTMDDGTTLKPVASNVAYKPKNKQRVHVNFTFLSDSYQGYDHLIKINRLQEILTKDIENLTEENEKEIGNDPIKILGLWVGDHYLNMHVGYNIGGEERHRISLVQNKINTSPSPNANNKIELELRHNSNEDPQLYGIKSYVAFNLRPLQENGKDSIDLIIKVQDFDNQVKEYKITYKYKNNSELTDNKTITEIPDDSDIY